MNDTNRMSHSFHYFAYGMAWIDETKILPSECVSFGASF